MHSDERSCVEPNMRATTLDHKMAGMVDPFRVTRTMSSIIDRPETYFPDLSLSGEDTEMALARNRRKNASPSLLLLHLIIALLPLLWIDKAWCIRVSDRVSNTARDPSDQSLKTAVFALGCFWRSEAVFGCLNGVVRTTVGYAGGSRANPEYRSLGDHAEAVQVEYDPKVISYRQLMDVFWSSHDPRQVFGQGPDVGNQYRSINFTNGTEESRIASMSKEREQTKSRSSIVTTQIQHLGIFYPAEPEHQKFELKRHPLLLQLIGNLPEEELENSSLAAKLNGYAAELCLPRIQRQIYSKINEIMKKTWPLLKDV